MKKFLKIILTVTALIFTPFVVYAQDDNEHWEICIECGGTGIVIVGEWDGNYYVESEVPCPVCGGIGYIGDKPATIEEPQPKEDEPTAENPQPKEDEPTTENPQPTEDEPTAENPQSEEE